MVAGGLVLLAIREPLAGTLTMCHDPATQPDQQPPRARRSAALQRMALGVMP